MGRTTCSIDTWGLYKAAEVDLDAITLLTTVLQRHFVALDFEGHIVSEYERCINRTTREWRDYPTHKLVREWLAAIIRRRAVYSYSSRLNAEHRRGLERLHFDTSDMPFVGLCYRTPDKLLIAEESDYTDLVKEFLRNEMGINVVTMAQALEQL